MFLDPDADLSIPQILKSQQEISLINITSAISLSRQKNQNSTLLLMADKPMKPVLPRPPGYRDPSHPVKSAPRPLPTKKTLVPPSLQPRKRRSRHYCRLCLCCSILLFVIVILLLVISGGLFYIWFDPKLPVFHLQSFKFPTFRVTKKSDGTYLTAKMVARIEVRNPNEKIMYHFGESEVGTTMGDEEVNLGSTSLPKFTQEKGNATSLKTVTSVKSELVEDRIGSAVLNQFKNKKLKVKMNVRTRVGITVAGMKTGVLGVEVLCGGVTLKETESGEMPRCVMKILKWIVVR